MGTTSTTPTRTRARVQLLGLYHAVAAALLAYVVYALWPVAAPGEGDAKICECVRLFAWHGTLHPEGRLILLVMAVGALGSYVHAATSFVTYVGNRTFVASWVWWYLLRPFIGMALALIFYFLIRGGLLSAGAGAKEVSPFGISAVAGLVGMFSKQATDKLRELFDQLFRTGQGQGDDQRTDKLIDGKPVTEAMITPDHITRIDLSQQRGEDAVPLQELIDLLGPEVTRVPVFDEGGAVRYVVHQSLLYKFISQRSIQAAAANRPLDVAAMTLADLVVAPDIGPLVRDAIAFVPRKATIGEAKAKMDGTQNCQDVFVTANGVRGEPVEGWLTNVEIGRRGAAS